MNNAIELSKLDLLIIAVYIILLAGIAAWASFGRKNRGGNLFTANRSLGWFAIGLTLWGTNVGPSMLIANASSGFETGLAAGNFSWYAFPFICLLAFVFAPRYLNRQAVTLPEYMGQRFGEQTRQYLAWYSILTILISWLGLTLFSGGVFMAQILDFPLWACILLLVAVSAAFTIAGGLKTIAYTNVYQMLLLIGVSLLLAVMAILKAGGLESVIRQTPATHWSLIRPLSDPDFPWAAILLGYPIMGVWFWCTDQSMVQSVLGAKNLKQGQLGANFCAWLKIIDVPLFILPGILCLALLPRLTPSTDAYLQLVKTVFPPGLLGLVVVIMSAALISTIAAALNSLSAVFTLDIYLKKRAAPLTEAQAKRTGRLLVAVGAILAVFLAIGISFIRGLSFFNIFQSVLGFLAPPMTAAFLFAVFWKKTSEKAVNLTLTLGALCSLGLGICYYAGLIFREMHFLYLSFLIFIALSVFLFIFSLASPAQSTETPSGKPVIVSREVKILWILLIIVMIGLYFAFSRPSPLGF